MSRVFAAVAVAVAAVLLLMFFFAPAPPPAVEPEGEGAPAPDLMQERGPVEQPMEVLPPEGEALSDETGDAEEFDAEEEPDTGDDQPPQG